MITLDGNERQEMTLHVGDTIELRDPEGRLDVYRIGRIRSKAGRGWYLIRADKKYGSSIEFEVRVPHEDLVRTHNKEYLEKMSLLNHHMEILVDSIKNLSVVPPETTEFFQNLNKKE